MPSNGGYNSYGSGGNYNGGYDSYGSGGNYNGGQATPKPKVHNKSNKTNETRVSKEHDTGYYQKSAVKGPSKNTGTSNDPRYYHNSGPV